MKELDFHPATDNINDVLFKVELIPITTVPFGGEGSSPNESLSIRDYLAVINMRNRECFSVVSKGYNLITNKEAMEMGKYVFRQLFPGINPAELIPYKVIASKRKTFCHIDLIHKNVNFTVSEQDIWYPFLRITNSYNKLYALSFEIGFVRKLCSNGCIFDKETIKVKINHTRSNLKWDISADVEKLKVLEKEFISHMLNLKRFFLPKRLVFPLMCKALNLNYEPKKEKEKENEIGLSGIMDSDKTQEEGMQLLDLTQTLAEQYAQEFGENAYAAFNAITDILSHQDNYLAINNYASRAKVLNSRLAEWVRTFTEEAEKRDFNLEKYLEKELSYPIFKATA